MKDKPYNLVKREGVFICQRVSNYIATFETSIKYRGEPYNLPRPDILHLQLSMFDKIIRTFLSFFLLQFCNDPLNFHRTRKISSLLVNSHEKEKKNMLITEKKTEVLFLFHFFLFFLFW